MAVSPSVGREPGVMSFVCEEGGGGGCVERGPEALRTGLAKWKRQEQESQVMKQLVQKQECDGAYGHTLTHTYFLFLVLLPPIF